MNFAIVLLVIAAVFPRFLALNFPPEIVFDEVHFGKFVTAYCCTGEHVFDIHPPHAKLLIAGFVLLAGYRGGFEFDHIGQSFPTSFPVFAFRFLPALAGSILPLIIFMLLRQLKVSLPFAFLGGLAVALDNAMVVQSRLISLDMILLCATFGSLSAYLASAKNKNWLWLSGGLAGLAVGSKFTGLAVVAVIGILVLVELRHSSWQKIFNKISVLVVSFLVVYLAGWFLHNNLLVNPGPGDAFYKTEISLFEKHKTMLGANYDLTATHPYASTWENWPLMLRAVFYWSGDLSVIYFLGNPLVWWGALVLAIAGVINVARHKKWLPLLGYGIAFLPLVRVPRALFLYHYLMPLIFSLLLGVAWLDFVVKDDIKKQKIVLFAGLLLLLVFLIFSPFTYGISDTATWRAALTWFPGWR